MQVGGDAGEVEEMLCRELGEVVVGLGGEAFEGEAEGQRFPCGGVAGTEGEEHEVDEDEAEGEAG